MTNNEIDDQVDAVSQEIAKSIRAGKDHLAQAIALAGVMSMVAEVAKRMLDADEIETAVYKAMNPR